MTTPNRDPRLRRTGGVFAAPVDVRAAAGRLEAAADAMRAEQLERGAADPFADALPIPPGMTVEQLANGGAAEEPPTGLLDLAAIRAALGTEPGGEVNPAAAAWLAGDDEPEPEPDPSPPPRPRAGHVWRSAVRLHA